MRKKEPNGCDVKVFVHHIYEYRKGLRKLILHTAKARCKREIVKILKSKKLNHLIWPVNGQGINVIFGTWAMVNANGC